MSPLAVIVAAAFWTLIWGPPGLLLSTPITACLVVLGRHVESLNFIEMLLGDRPPLSPEQSFYQRILASDPDEAAFQAERLLKTMPLQDYYENVALPALALAQADVDRGVLETNRQPASTPRSRISSPISPTMSTRPTRARRLRSNRRSPRRAESRAAGAQGLCFAGRTPLDQAASAILVQLLEREGAPAQMSGPASLSADASPPFDVKELGAIAIIHLDRLRTATLRYSVRRLRKRFPGAPIVVCVWGAGELSDLAEIANADATVASLAETIDFCIAATRSMPAADARPEFAETRSMSRAEPATALLELVQLLVARRGGEHGGDIGREGARDSRRKRSASRRHSTISALSSNVRATMPTGKARESRSSGKPALSSRAAPAPLTSIAHCRCETSTSA